MTQATQIFSFLLKNPLTRPKEIAKKLKIPSASVRRALFNLREKNIVSKPRKDGDASIKLHTKETNEFQDEHNLRSIKDSTPKKASKLFWVKILKTGKSEKWETNLVASTWEHFEGGEESRFSELKKAMKDWAELEKNIDNIDVGYSKTSRKTEPKNIPEFPKIEVHNE